MRLLLQSLIRCCLALALCGCGSNLGDTAVTTTLLGLSQVTVTISGTSLAGTAGHFISNVTAFRARVLSPQGVQLATTTVPRDTSQDTQTLTMSLPSIALPSLIVTVEALDGGGATVSSLGRKAGGLSTLTVSDMDFTAGPLPAFQLPTSTAPTTSVADVNPYRGLGGTTITLTGNDVAAIAYVAFGTSSLVPATQLPGQDKVTVVAPERPVGTIAPLSYFDRLGKTIDIPSQFYYYTESRNPTIRSTTPNTGPQGGGTQITLTGSGFTGAWAVYFGETRTPITSFVSDGQIIVTSPAVPQAGVYPLSVQVRDSMGAPSYNSPEIVIGDTDLNFNYQ